ncbi:MAG: hypothetical protein DMG48_03915 [Acidobacteria bacterium]|nr:MAG: hypothetical protein DMG48_03915 [Acidobacteriota bacterium]
MGGFACDPRRGRGDEILFRRERRGPVVGWKILNQLHKFRGCSVKQRTFCVLFAAFLVLAASGVAWSQTVQGVITGTITDPTGAVVPGATVTITNVGTNISQTTTTGSDGSYRFPLVPPGSYTLEIKAANFGGVRVSGVVVEASQTIAINRQLELAKTSQLVEVTSEAPLVQTATSDLATQIDRTTIENAPLADRDVFSTLPFLAPQVSPGLNMNPTSGGARESGTAYLLNGGDDNDNFSEGAINIHPPLESVQDFTIKTNSMTAEYGRGVGAVVSANQVSGTNKLHGTVYEFNRNASLNAADFFSNAAGLPKPKYIRNQFGGIVSGPIRKDKTFFSFAYDRIKLLSGSPLTATTNPNWYVPTTAALATLTANAGPVAKQILGAYPPLSSDSPCPNKPSSTGAGFQVGCVSFFDPQTDTNNIYYGRVDHNFTAKDRLSFAANIFREAFVDQYGGGGLTKAGPINGTTNNHFHNLTLDETHIFKPSLLNEVTVAHNRHFNTFIEGNGTQAVPHIIIDNKAEGSLGYSFGPFEGGLVQGFVQDRWGATDNLTWTVGRHSLKFGGGNQSGILYRNWDLGLPGYYEFRELNGTFTPASDGVLQPDGTIAGISPAKKPHTNFQNDYPYFQETSIDPRTGAKASAYRHYTYHDWYTFIQDDWKLSPRLTLNLGVRWDRYGAPAEDHGILAQFTNLGGCDIATDRACIGAARVGPVGRMWNTNNKDFAPRIGFAWDVKGNGKMAVRGGYGIYYDRIFDNIWSNGAWNPPFYALIDFDASSSDAINYSNPNSIGTAYNPNGPNGPIPYPGKRVSVRTMDVNMRDSSGQNFYLGVERQFLGNFLFRVNYQGSMGRHLPMLENYNRTDGQAYNASFSNIRPNALYTGFNYRSNSVSSNYNSLVAEAQKRMGHGLQFQTGYTYAKLLDVNSELFAGCSTIGSFTAPYYYISNTRPALSYGRAAFDHRHSYKFNVIYEVPFLKQQKGIVGHALGGWTVSSFMQLYSGHPVDVYLGSNGRFQAQTVVCNNPPTCTSTTTTLYNDQNGIPFNIAGDYNLDNVLNDHPNFLGSNLNAVYSGKSPADGIFKDNNPIGCGFPGATSQGVPQAAIDYCNAQLGIGTPNSLFGNPAYPSGNTPYLRFGTLGRNIFHGPKFVQMDLALGKSFKLTESMKLDFRASAQNVLNHPSFDCVDGDLDSGTFGAAQCLAQNPSGTTLGAPTSRIMSLGLRLAF